MPKKEKDPQLVRKEGLYVKDTGTEKGRGVFCRQDIKAGETLEITPALILNEKETESIDTTRLVDYIFTLGGLSKLTRMKNNLQDRTLGCAIVMGLMSFCNHDENPNAEVLWEEENGTLYHTLKARRPIKKNTEICTSYGKGWFEDRR